MKMITATEANRDFSRLLEEVAAGELIGITKHGRLVATISPVTERDEEAEALKQEHVDKLLSRPAMNIPLGRRDELYDD